MLAHWAQQTTRRVVRGALLATPPGLRAERCPTATRRSTHCSAGGWLPVPRARLPFPSIVARQPQRPARPLRARRANWLRDWGSASRRPGRVGHLNPASGLRRVAARRSSSSTQLCRCALTRMRPGSDDNGGDVRSWPSAIRLHQSRRPRGAASSRPSRSASPARARRACATATWRSTSSTSTSAPGATRCRCRTGWARDAVGVVEAVGEGVTDVKAGDRVGYLLGPQGAYSDVRADAGRRADPAARRRVRPHAHRR